jgi:hypothetical protein
MENEKHNKHLIYVQKKVALPGYVLSDEKAVVNSGAYSARGICLPWVS